MRSHGQTTSFLARFPANMVVPVASLLPGMPFQGLQPSIRSRRQNNHDQTWWISLTEQDGRPGRLEVPGTKSSILLQRSKSLSSYKTAHHIEAIAHVV